ncbi:MAG: response regulator transcription factor [Rhodothermales bacterium]|nr:response regulator transcription factor [Rhodothermales bacterium]
MPPRTPSEAARRRVLVVDDEEDLLDLLQYNLEKEGFEVLLANNGVDGIEVARKEEPDLIVLDIMMPGLDGIEVCRRLRSDAVLRDTPILMLTARTEESAQVQSLEIGADIYLPKPVSIPVLISQIKALMRTANRGETLPAILVLQDIEIDRDRYLVVQKTGKEPIEHRLPRKEFELLYFLASHPGKVFSRQDVLDKVWGHDVFVVDRTVDVHIRKIREKLGNDTIETVKGIGYKFKA